MSTSTPQFGELISNTGSQPEQRTAPCGNMPLTEWRGGMKTVVTSVCAAVLCAAVAVPAHADPIQISAGALTWTAGGGGGTSGSGATLVLEGDQGFTFSGTTGFGIFAPGECGFPVCTAGSTVDLRAHWVGNDLSGTATFAGQRFTGVGGLGDDAAQLSTEWTGTLVIPAGFSGGMLSAPFLFSGVFAYPENPGDPLTRVPLVGSGTATLQFSPYPGAAGAFTLDAARYQFEQAPVPEPSTLLLVGMGAAGLARVRARRRREEP